MFNLKSKVPPPPPAPIQPAHGLEVDLVNVFRVKAHGLGILAAPLVITLLIVAVVLTSTFGVRAITGAVERFAPEEQAAPEIGERPPT